MNSHVFSCKIVHELPWRLRIRSSLVFDTNLDPAFLIAVISNIKGVEKVRLNLRAGSAVVHYRGGADVREKIVETMMHPPGDVFRSEAEQEHPLAPLDVAARGIVSLLTLMLPQPVAAPLGIVVSLPVIFEGLDVLLKRGVKVEVLDASAVAFSLARGDYFTASSIVALLSLGTYLEEQSERRSSDLLKTLLRPTVEKVWVERDGIETGIAVDALLIGDIVICGPGELIPVDGIVIQGEALVNQSSITGESMPVHVKPGDEVLSASVIDEGKIKINARQVGTDTGMARITRFLEHSLKSKSATQKKSDELADKLVPITFALGIAIFLATRDVVRAASVLTVDYSCAIKLATPVAVRSAMYTAAGNHVLLKGAEALDTLARVDTLIFDKTGTLTRGVLDVVDIIPFNDISPEELLGLAAGAEEHYAHPVANAVVDAAKKRNIPLPETGEVDFVVAHGVSAYINGSRILVGSRHFIEDDEGIDCTEAHAPAEAIMRQGKSLLYVAGEKSLLGIIALQDQIREEAHGVLTELKQLGIQKIIVLTGDHMVTAKAFAGELDMIDEIHWELKPGDKAAIIENVRADGALIAFAGDGVNDAPAMVTADLGICMPEGADIARDASQLVLLKEDLNCLVESRKIAVRNLKSIENSFKAAVGLNSAILLLASTGRLLPVTSAILHNSSTLGILGYAGMANSMGNQQKNKRLNEN